MEPASPEVLAKLISTNKSRIRNLDLTATQSSITIGRDPSNLLCVPDQRISGFHCVCSVLREPSGEVKFMLEDKSSNGTFVNLTKVGRGNSVQLKNGDEIGILSEATVGPNEAIGFSFVISETSLKRKRPEEEVKPQEMKKPKVEVKLSDDLMCPICTEIIHQCVTIMPCLHNVCGGCYSLWMDRSKECPSCREPVSEVKRNATVSNIIESYLTSNPELRRPPEELKELEESNKITHDTMAISKPAKAAPAKPVNLQACPQCERAIDGFKCKPHQDHLPCTTCQRLLPVRMNNRIQCQVCRAVSCVLYWGGKYCKEGLGALNGYRALVGAIPADVFRGNEIEKKVLMDYIAGAKLALPTIFDEMVTDMELQNWDLPLNDTNTTLRHDSLVCKACASAVWCELLYKYRLKINHLIPVFLRNKPNCKYGRECRTQRKKDHAARYNHICEKAG